MEMGSPRRRLGDVSGAHLPAQVLGHHSALDVEGKLRRRSVQVNAPAVLPGSCRLLVQCFIPDDWKCEHLRLGLCGTDQLSVWLPQVCDLHERLKHIDMHGHHLPWDNGSSNGRFEGGKESGGERHRARRGLQRSASHSPQGAAEPGSTETQPPAQPPLPKVSCAC